ncbi:MAG: LysR substrate-binding domain-containing protein [Paracoccaceae bacterium]|nr:LysR substrate-binding domain-containing protein [Paracoccaceae bacterium]
MDWTRIPPLNSLRAFSALAANGTYAQAGRVLNVTHAAVRQQVRQLEEHLQVTLVDRAGRGMVLTEDGRMLARELENSFGRIARATESLRHAGAARPVQVTMSPAFAVKWLMPRLADFQARHPDTTLLLNPSGQFMELKPGGIEVAIRYQRFENLTPAHDVLLPVDLVVVAVPELVRGRAVGELSDLTDLPWLQELGTSEVLDLMQRNKITPSAPMQISHMPGNLIMDAIIRGDGLTYTVRQWVEEDIRAGRLVQLFAEEEAGAFCIHTPAGEQREAVRQLIRWLRRQVAPDQN